MQGSWEAVSAIAATASSAGVLVALIIAVRQLRVGAAQVEHLRRATQLDGTMKILRSSVARSSSGRVISS